MRKRAHVLVDTASAPGFAVAIGIASAAFASAVRADSPARIDAPSSPSQAVSVAEVAQRGPEVYEARRVLVFDFIGRVDVNVMDQGPVELVLSGPPDELAKVEAAVFGDTLRIVHHHDEVVIWTDWSELPAASLRVPAGTPLELDGFIGEARIGDLVAPFALDLGAGRVDVGNVSDTEVEINGGGAVHIARIAGRLALEIMGSGRAEAGDVDGPVDARIAGSGDMRVGAVAGPLDLDIRGSGDADVAAVAGPVSVRLGGSSDVRVFGGRAAPLSVAITGSGGFRLDGEAVDPDLSISGSGSIHLQRYSGELRRRTTGSGAIRIGM